LKMFLLFDHDSLDELWLPSHSVTGIELVGSGTSDYVLFLNAGWPVYFRQH
jgi:hypothetical protein